MKISLILLVLLLPVALSAQTIWVANRETGKEVALNPRKIKVVVSKDGEFFRGKVVPKATVLQVDGLDVPYSSIGFLEVKKFHSRALISSPLKFLGTAFLAIGGVILAVESANEFESDFAVGLSGFVLVGSGFALTKLGKKAEAPNASKFTVLHTKDWHFFYR